MAQSSALLPRGTRNYFAGRYENGLWRFDEDNVGYIFSQSGDAELLRWFIDNSPEKLIVAAMDVERACWNGDVESMKYIADELGGREALRLARAIEGGQLALAKWIYSVQEGDI